MARTASSSSLGSACVAIIDGAKLLLTPFRRVVVPPPMAAHTVQLPSTVNQVTFGPPPRCNDFLVLLASGQVAVFSYDVVSEGGGVKKKDSQGFRERLCPPEMVGVTKYVSLVSCVMPCGKIAYKMQENSILTKFDILNVVVDNICQKLLSKSI